MNRSVAKTDTDKFREQMKKFLNQLRQWGTREQIKQLDKYEMKINLAMKANCRGSIGYFIESLLPYGHQILTGDDSYFLSNDFEVETEEDQMLQNQLKDWWPKFTSDQKDIIRNKVKLLLMLGTIASHNEDMRQIINCYRDPSNPLLF